MAEIDQTGLAPDEWQQVPRTPEGRPRITVHPESPDIPEGEHYAPPVPDWDEIHQMLFPPEPEEKPKESSWIDTVNAPWRLASEAVKEATDTGADVAKAYGSAFSKSANEAAVNAIKSYFESTEGKYYPEGFPNDPNIQVGDDGQFYDREGNVIPLTPKPALLPITRDPRTGETEGAMPGALDIVNTLGSPVKGVGSLGAGLSGFIPPFLRRAPAVGPTGRQIVHGYSDAERMTFDKVYTRTMDDLNPIKTLEKQFNEFLPLGPGEHSYELARLTRGAYGRTQQALQHGTFDFNTMRNNGPGLKQILKPVGDRLDDFERFAVASRDVELINRGINTGTTLADAQAVVAAAPREFRQALKQLHDYQSRILDYLKDSGVISQEAVNNMRALNKNYVPFYRLMDSGNEFGSSMRTIKTYSPIRGIEGSSRDILSPIESIIRNTHLFLDLAEKNRALTAMAKAAENRALSGLMTKVKAPTHPVHVSRDEVEKFFQSAGLNIPGSVQQLPDYMTIFRKNAFRPAPDEISVFKNGKREVYKVDPEVANAVNGMGHQEVSAIMKMLSLPAQTLRAGAVYDPGFMVKNFTRDQLTALVFTKNGYLPVVDFLRGVGHLAFKTDTYQKWLKAGGANSNLVAMDRTYIADEIRNLTKSGLLSQVRNVVTPQGAIQALTSIAQGAANLATHPGQIPGAIGRTVQRPFNALSKMAEYSEQPTRIAEFAKSQKRGKSAHKGAYESREVTVDFARRGSEPLIQNLARMTAFMNPQIQGVDRLARAYKENKGATLFKIGAGVTMPSLYFYWRNFDDPRMRHIPRWERDLYWHVPTDDWQEFKPLPETGELGVPDAEGQWAKIPEEFRRESNGQKQVNLGNVYRIAKPFEIGVAFGTSVERALDAWFEKHPEAWKEFDKSMKQAFVPSVLPQVAQPFVEGMTGHSFFRERPIVPQRLESPAARQYEYGPFTSETAKLTGSLIGKITPRSGFASPMVIENGILGWSGTLGKYALDGIDRVIFGKKKPEMTEADMPVIRSFVSRMPTTASAEVQDFYQNINDLKANKRLLKRLEGEGKAVGTAEDEKESVEALLNKEPGHKNRPTDFPATPETFSYSKEEKAINNQFAMMRRVQEAPNITPADKRKLLDWMTFSVMSMAKQWNSRYHEALKKLKPTGTQDEPEE